MILNIIGRGRYLFCAVMVRFCIFRRTLRIITPVNIPEVSIMQLTKEEYSKMYEQEGTKTKWWVTFPKAFFIGGGICVLGQGLTDLYGYLGADSKAASTLATVTLIFLSALLTSLGLYHKLARHAGAGTLVPVTGFANSVAAPAVEFRSEGYITGLGAKIFIISGPVILYGILASVLAGVYFYFR